MNPQDLLYTNSFVATNDIDFSQDKLTRDRINVLKTIDQPFPKKYNRNWEPIISDEVRDIVKDRYKKYKITTVLLDSRDRNHELYPSPNNYLLSLSRQFNYIESIQLININLNNLFLTKTQISWIFPSNIGGEFSIEIPCGIYNINKMSQILSSKMSTIPDHDGNIQNIDVIIHPEFNDIKIINRIQVPEIVAIQALLTNSDDVFGTLNVASIKSGLYFVIPQQSSFSNKNLPIVPTNISNLKVGGFSIELFNCQEFWDGNIDGNEYTFIDSFVINGQTYQRYLLIPRINGEEMMITTSQNIIYNTGLSNYLLTNSNAIYTNNFKDCLPQIGEAREFTIDFDNSPIMEIFGWKECEEEFRYILSNNDNNNISKNKCFQVYQCLNSSCNEYMVKIEPYILLKLSAPSYTEDTIAGNIIKSQQLPKTGNDNDNKDVINIFAKICINRENKIESGILKYYETPLEKLDEIMVTFVDNKGCVIDLKCDHTIILEIVEAVDVLKDTLIDSRHGEANITGIR